MRADDGGVVSATGRPGASPHPSAAGFARLVRRCRRRRGRGRGRRQRRGRRSSSFASLPTNLDR